MITDIFLSPLACKYGGQKRVLMSDGVLPITVLKLEPQ